ncbi:MAG: rane protein involved in cytochrome biosis [Bacillales bacterium]|jgi:membrane protein CcdC involved in cytochrome C biogenesis|nr:rane protein involved in cytochrome biosis [Bacillales bacterium]
MSENTIILGSVIISLFMVAIVNFFRLKNTKKPVKNAKSIIIPPFGMAMGFSMFIFAPALRPTWTEIIYAVIAGVLCSVFLIKTSKFEVRENQIYLQRSKLFFIVLIGLVLIRYLAKFILSTSYQLDAGEMSGMFFILAFSMILPWRIGMLIGYKKIEKQLQSMRAVNA